jgi:UDP-2,3-diacylglucosamine hydrolase
MSLGLIAGFGAVPVAMVRNAQAQGHHVAVFSLSKDNRPALQALCPNNVYPISPGLLGDTLAKLQTAGIAHVVFGGKVNKWILLRNPRLDARGKAVLATLPRLNDDALMLGLIEALEAEGFTVLPQSQFMQGLFVQAGLLAGPALSPQQQADCQYGFDLAKAMGGVDVGQTVVVHNGMPIAIEAIEGTDVCLKRAGKLINGVMALPWRGPKTGGVVVKTAKPKQDQRFDIPTVGTKTLKAMRRVGLQVLAVEAGATLALALPEMQAYANRYGLSLLGL